MRLNQLPLFVIAVVFVAASCLSLESAGGGSHKYDPVVPEVKQASKMVANDVESDQRADGDKSESRQDADSDLTDEDRARRSAADLRTIATAIGVYAIDMGFYPRGLTEIGQLEKYVVPIYLTKLPIRDGWGTTYNFRTGAVGTNYTIASLGRDKTKQGCILGTESDNLDSDICHSGGMFIQWPGLLSSD